MAAIGSGRGIMDSQNQVQSDTVDRLKVLYPNVNEDETPLPRSWSTKDKFSYIGLSQNNLRVHYKGHELSGSHNKINQEILDVQCRYHCGDRPEDTVEHTVGVCLACAEPRCVLGDVVGDGISCKALVQVIVRSEGVSDAVHSFCEAVLLAKEEGKRVRKRTFSRPSRRERHSGHRDRAMISGHRKCGSADGEQAPRVIRSPQMGPRADLQQLKVQDPNEYRLALGMTAENFEELLSLVSINIQGVRGDNTRVAVIAMEYGCTVPGQPGSGTLPMGFSQL
uniref:SFRICE_002966 n=1 Tax=Spodoptera frugiperda TaxID=7108 RepID=A0A2H1W3T1_SPOFR